MRGAAEVKDHPWLKYYPWKELYEKKLEAPFIPKLGDNFDKKYCEGPDKIGDTTKERYEKYVREENFHIAFKHFTVFNNLEETNCNINNKNQSAKNRPKDHKESSNSASSTTRTRPMHMRSSSVSVPSSAFLNHNNLNSNYNNANYLNRESLKYINNNNINFNNNNNNPISNHNSSNNLNSTVLKSKVKIIDRDLRSSSNLGASSVIGVNGNSTLRSSVGAYHKQAQSYNSSLYGNMMQSNSNFGSSKQLDKSSDKRTGPILHDSSKSIKMPTSRLPNINSIDKLKLKKLINSSSSNLLFKYYKQSANSNNSTGASLTNQIFGKKSSLVASQQYSNLNNHQ